MRKPSFAAAAWFNLFTADELGGAMREENHECQELKMQIQNSFE